MTVPTLYLFLFALPPPCAHTGSQRTELTQLAGQDAHIELLEAGQVGHIAPTECHALKQISIQVAQRLKEPLAAQDPWAGAGQERFVLTSPSLQALVKPSLNLFAVPMNKVQVGHAPSPNLKAVRSKIGSLDNATYKPGGGNVKIESKKIDIKAGSRIEAKNDKYMPKGGEKKVGLNWSTIESGLPTQRWEW